MSIKYDPILNQLKQHKDSDIPHHNLIKGIQGGKPDEYYHLTELEYEIFKSVDLLVGSSNRLLKFETPTTLTSGYTIETDDGDLIVIGYVQGKHRSSDNSDGLTKNITFDTNDVRNTVIIKDGLIIEWKQD